MDCADKKASVCEIDLAQFGFFKYHLEPDIIAVHLRFKNVAGRKELRYRLQNLKAQVSQAGKKSVWKPVDEKTVLKTDRRQTLPLNLDIVLPKDKTKQYLVNEGKVLHTAADMLVSEVTFRVINSRYK